MIIHHVYSYKAHIFPCVYVYSTLECMMENSSRCGLKPHFYDKTSWRIWKLRTYSHRTKEIWHWVSHRGEIKSQILTDDLFHVEIYINLYYHVVYIIYPGTKCFNIVPHMLLACKELLRDRMHIRWRNLGVCPCIHRYRSHVSDVYLYL